MIKNFPKITIITANYNGGKYLEKTILSVINQKYPNLEYIIIDGDSTDNSVQIISKYQQYLTYWVSEKDSGLYDALQKGFDKSTGEIMGWLNSDDLLHSNSLFVIADAFINNLEVEWIEGTNTSFDIHERTIQVIKQTPKHLYWFLSHLYKTNINSFIQQESTYWRRSLWAKTGATLNTNYKLAGDFELWLRFFSNAQLFHINTLIGGFRYRGIEQLSVGCFDKYIDECTIAINTQKDILSPKQKFELKKYITNYRLLSKIPRFGYSLKNRYISKYYKNKEITFDTKTFKFRL